MHFCNMTKCNVCVVVSTRVTPNDSTCIRIMDIAHLLRAEFPDIDEGIRLCYGKSVEPPDDNLGNILLIESPRLLEVGSEAEKNFIAFGKAVSERLESVDLFG